MTAFWLACCVLALAWACTELSVWLAPLWKRPGEVECPVCDGEGYRYVEQAGRHATNPIVEIPCVRCAGTGLTESRTA